MAFGPMSAASYVVDSAEMLFEQSTLRTRCGTYCWHHIEYNTSLDKWILPFGTDMR